MKEIDARGLSCPQPVLLFAEAARTENEIDILVDDVAPLENVSRFAENHGYKVSVAEAGDHQKISARK